MISDKSSNPGAAASKWCWISPNWVFGSLMSNNVTDKVLPVFEKKHFFDVDSYCVSNRDRVSFPVINKLWPFCTQGNELHILWFILTRDWTRLLCTVPGLFIVCTRTSNQCHFFGFTEIIRQSYHATSCPWGP